MSYSEKDGQVILTMSREECEYERLNDFLDMAACGSSAAANLAGRGEARMTIDDKAKIALQQPDTGVLTTEMNPELAEKFSRVAGQVHDLLRANTRGPVEAYMILHFLMKSWEDTYGIRGAMAIENGGES